MTDIFKTHTHTHTHTQRERERERERESSTSDNKVQNKKTNYNCFLKYEMRYIKLYWFLNIQFHNCFTYTGGGTTILLSGVLFFYFCRHILKTKYRVSKDARKNNDMTLQVLNKIILVLFEEKKCVHEKIFIFVPCEKKYDQENGRKHTTC